MDKSKSKTLYVYNKLVASLLRCRLGTTDVKNFELW